MSGGAYRGDPGAGEMPGHADCPAELPAPLGRAVARLRSPLRVCVATVPALAGDAPGWCLAYVGVGPAVVAPTEAEAVAVLARQVRARLESQGQHDAALLAALDEAARR